MSQVTVVIPVRKGTEPLATLRSLACQTFRDFSTVVVYDLEQRGAPWARNRGLELVQTPFVLFSDDDIRWEPNGLADLHRVLAEHPEASYSYGSYFMAGIGEQCGVDFDAKRLRQHNFVSTMSLVRTADHPGWDESLARAQDWDVWLTMLERGEVGVFCGTRIFQTDMRAGITYGNGLSWEAAKRIVMRKHGLS